MARRSSTVPPQRLILDSGAIVSLARHEQRARAYLQRAFEVEASIEVPAVVIAETIRGGLKDAPVQRILNAIGQVAATTESHGQIAGALLGATRSSATIDALVVAHAVEGGGALVLTGDPDDLSRLAARHPEVWIQGLEAPPKAAGT